MDAISLNALLLQKTVEGKLKWNIKNSDKAWYTEMNGTHFTVFSGVKTVVVVRQVLQGYRETFTLRDNDLQEELLRQYPFIVLDRKAQIEAMIMRGLQEL